MDQSKGAGTFKRTQVRVHNDTPRYIKPLGELPPNDIMPNYQNPPSWVYEPQVDLRSELNKVKSEIKSRKK